MDEDRLDPLDLPGLDITGDGQFTVADLPAWGMHVLGLPGDAALALLIRHAPGLAQFLELGTDDYGGTVSIVISAVAWLAALIVLGLVVNAIRNLYHRLGSYLIGRWNELLRLARITRRRITSRIGMLRQRRAANAPSYAVGELELERLDAAVLRCFANVGEMRVLVAADVAATLKVSLRQVQTALRRLGEHRLIEPAFGTGGGREGHLITRAGQIYLIEH